MYTPEPNALTAWVYQDGKPAFNGKFTDTGAIRNFSEVETLIARWGDPRPALRTRPEVAPGEDIEALVKSPRGLAHFRFKLDPEKGELPGLLNAAGKDPDNEWHIESPENLDSLTALRQAMDFAACGDIATLRARYGSFVGKPSGGATVNAELDQLRKKLADALAARDKAVREAADAKDAAAKAGLDREVARKNLSDALSEVAASAAGMKKAAGTKPKGQYQQALVRSAEGLDKLVATYRQKAGM